MSTYRNSSYRNRRRSGRMDLSDGWLSILLYYVLPFVIINGILFFCVTTRPKCTISLAETNDYLTTEVAMTIDSWFPTKEISLSMDSEPIELEKGKGRTYKAIITKNGSLEANITNINGMSTTQFEHVNILDDNPPSIEFQGVEEGVVTLLFSDSQSGINFDSIYALNSDDIALNPLSLDRATATVTFEMDAGGIRVFAQDMAGNEVQGTFTSHKEGENEILDGGEIPPEEEETAATAE